MAYRFSLAAVLLVRQQREAAEERRLEAVQREMRETEGQLGQVRTALAGMAAERARGEQQVMQATALHASYARWALLDEARRECEARLLAVREQVRAQQGAYVAARREREMLEQMKADGRAAWAAATARAEQLRSDDLFLSQRSGASARGGDADR